MNNHRIVKAALIMLLLAYIGLTVYGIARPEQALNQSIANLIAVAALVVFSLTLRAQLDANRIQLDSLRREIENQNSMREVQLLSRFLEELRHDVATLTLPVELRREEEKGSQQKLFSGKEAIEKFVKGLEEEQDHTPFLNHPFFIDLYFIIGSFDTFRSRILKSTLPEFEKRHLISRFCFLYTSKLMMALTRLLAVSEKGKLNIQVKTVTVMNRSEMLHMILQAHRKMIDFIQEAQV